MRRALLMLLAAPLLAHGQALTQLAQPAQCPFADPRGCASSTAAPSTTPLLSILPGGPTAGQIATGSLNTAAGVALADSRASIKYVANSSGTLVSLANNAVPVDPVGILAEGPSTNVVVFSNDLTQNSWGAIVSSGSVTITANSTDVTDPAGGNTSAKLVFPSVGAGGYAVIRQDLNIPAATNGGSVYLMGTSSGTIYYDINGASTNIATCSFTSTAWTRCVIVAADTGASGFVDVGVNTLAGDSPQPAQTVYVWNSSLEANPFASSANPSTGNSSAVRAADDLSVANPLPAAGTTYCVGATIKPEASAWSGTQGILVAGAAASANTWSLSLTSSGKPTFSVYGSNGAQKVYTASSAISAVQHRVQACNAAGTLTVNVDGSSAAGSSTGTGTGSTTSQPANVLIGETATGGTNPLNGWEFSICADPSALKCVP